METCCKCGKPIKPDEYYHLSPSGVKHDDCANPQPREALCNPVELVASKY